MKNLTRSLAAISLAAAAFLFSAQAFAQSEDQGQGRAIITILPKHDGDPVPSVSPKGVKLSIQGKEAQVTGFKSVSGPQDNLEIVVLIDGGARSSLGNQMEDIAHFIQRLPPNARVAVAYMLTGNAQLTGPLTDDRAAVIRTLHIPSGIPGINASPYFCLSDLAKRWPSQEPNARREVVMITDGVDNYNRRFDPDDPYVQAAMTDAAKVGIIVYSIYWRDRGLADNTQYANNTGQNLLQEVSQSTGGRFYGIGLGNPVSLEPYFDEINRRLRNQYELSFLTRLHGKPQVQNFKLKFSVPGASIDSPQQVFIYPQGPRTP
jgi:hypothetical protein